jgi:hypothetical protein
LELPASIRFARYLLKVAKYDLITPTYAKELRCKRLLAILACDTTKEPNEALCKESFGVQMRSLILLAPKNKQPVNPIDSRI